MGRRLNRVAARYAMNHGGDRMPVIRSRPKKLNHADTVLYEIYMLRFAADRLKREQLDDQKDAWAVLQASPSSQSARPVSRELPVDPHRDHRWDFPCCVWSPCLHAVAITPAGLMETCSLIRFHQLRPSPKPWRVGSCIVRFEACSAFTHITACLLT